MQGKPGPDQRKLPHRDMASCYLFQCGNVCRSKQGTVGYQSSGYRTPSGKSFIGCRTRGIHQQLRMRQVNRTYPTMRGTEANFPDVID